MRGRLRQWWALVLRLLRERQARTPWEPASITDDEMAQLARDSWGLYEDVARHSLLPCTPRACMGRLASVVTGTRIPTARVVTRRDERGTRRWARHGRTLTRRQGGFDKGRAQTLGGACMDDPVGPLII